MMRRRAFVLAAAGGGAFAVCGLVGRDASALGRTPLAGSVRISLPVAIRSLDPHELTDPLAALFGHAVFDTLVVHDARGFGVGLAESLPRREAGVVTVRLRAGLKTAHGKALEGRDVVASLKRSRARGAGAILESVGSPVLSAKDPLTVVFSKGSPAHAILALASPLCAIVPRSFDPRRPDGTGAFTAQLKDKQLTLSRNANAALGPSFLDLVTVTETSDLRDGIRDFEVGRADVSWLGTGLFRGRPDAQAFDLGSAATYALVASASGPLGKPGDLQKLVDSIPRAALAHLGLGALPVGSSTAAYDGPPIELWVEPSAHLVEIADAFATALSTKDHEITVRRASRDDIAARRRRGETMLSLHAVRALDTQGLPHGAEIPLLEDPTRTKLKVNGATLREIARSTRVAILGDLRVAGGKSPDFVFATHAKGGWDLSASRVKKRR